MKECPNCGTKAQDQWVLCPSCRMNMLEAAVRLGRDHYVSPEDEVQVDRSSDLTAYELPRRSPVVMPAAPEKGGAPLALWGGSFIIFVAMWCPVATIGLRTVPFTTTGYGVIFNLAGLLLLGTVYFRRPRAALYTTYGILAGAILLAMIFSSSMSGTIGDVGWGWGLLSIGAGVAVAGARGWVAIPPPVS